MKNLFRAVVLSLFVFCPRTDAAPPTTGQFLFQRKTSGPFDQYGVTPVTGQAFGWNGTSVVTLSLGTGTVTSVAMTVPNWLSISGSPVTTTGTLAVTAANQSANTFLAGPATGSPAAPVFRVLADADLPASAVTLTGTQTVSNKTLTAPIVAGGMTASGSAPNTFAGSTGTFVTSTGANTLSGATTINDATTPSLTTASGKVNTGFVTISGKTSGALKFTTSDATAQTVTVSLAAQTMGAATLTIPNLAGTSGTFITTRNLSSIGIVAQANGGFGADVSEVNGFPFFSNGLAPVFYGSIGNGSNLLTDDSPAVSGLMVIDEMLALNSVTFNSDITVVGAIQKDWNDGVAFWSTGVLQTTGEAFGASYLPTSLGGLGSANTYVDNDLIYFSGTGFTRLAAEAGVLYSDGGPPVWTETPTIAGDNITNVAKPVRHGSVSGQTASVANVAGSYTTPNDSILREYRINVRAKVSAVAAGILTFTVAFTDEDNVSQTATIFPSGTTTAGLSTTGYKTFPPMVICCKDNTAVTVAATLTIGTMTYNAGATIEIVVTH